MAGEVLQIDDNQLDMKQFAILFMILGRKALVDMLCNQGLVKDGCQIASILIIGAFPHVVKHECQL